MYMYTMFLLASLEGKATKGLSTYMYMYILSQKVSCTHVHVHHVHCVYVNVYMYKINSVND